MNNEDQAGLARLLWESNLCVELHAEEGGIHMVMSYTYVIFIPEIQKLMLNTDNLDSYDGIHWTEEDTYAAYGKTLKDTWDEFVEKNMDFIERGITVDQYCEELKKKHEL